MKTGTFLIGISLLTAALLTVAPVAMAGSDPALEEAARVTGVVLAEHRAVADQAEYKNKDGSQNHYLQHVKRHQLELTELMALKMMIGRELKNMEGVSEEDMQNQIRAAVLLAKIMALQAQSLRYKAALNASQQIADSGFKPLMSNPESWNGQMCNRSKQCTQIQPITGLFILARESREKKPGPE